MAATKQETHINKLIKRIKANAYYLQMLTGADTFGRLVYKYVFFIFISHTSEEMRDEIVWFQMNFNYRYFKHAIELKMTQFLFLVMKCVPSKHSVLHRHTKDDRQRFHC